MSNSNPLYAYSLTQSKAKEVMAYIRSKSSNQPGKGAANQQNKYLKTNILPYDLREVSQWSKPLFISNPSFESTTSSLTMTKKKQKKSLLQTDITLKHRPMTVQNSSLQTASDDPTLFFRDGKRRIDMVLAFEDEEEDGTNAELVRRRRKARQVYQENLELAGLDLEMEHRNDSFDRKTYFVKIHAPRELLQRNSEIMGMKTPVKEFIVTYYTSRDSSQKKKYSSSAWWLTDGATKSIFNCNTITPEPNIFFPGFLPDIMDKYVLKERSGDHSNIQRTQIVWQVLTRVRYDNSSREKAGIARLINKNVYTAVYPLHEGEYDYGNEELNKERLNERMVLYQEWATLKNWYKKQPLWMIRKYFGVKIGLYFAWLGFYTQALIIPSVVGILCFLFGLSTMFSPLNKASNDICDENIMGNVTMCPQCDTYCPYWRLKDSCILSRVTYLFDNSATVFFAIFMSVWATTFLEVWKRRQAILQWEWDLHGEEDDDEIRPEYEQGVKTTRLNPITQKREPFVSAKEKVFRLGLTSSIVLFMVIMYCKVFFSV